jgi:hypothetical protein
VKENLISHSNLEEKQMTTMTTETSTTPAERDATTVVPTVQAEEVVQPKRPLSAYNYFFRSERARLVGVDLDLKEVADVHNRKKRRHRKTHGKMGFREMANKVGERWRGLTDEEKIPFVKMFEDDRARYKTELKVWNDLQKEKKKETVKKEKEAVKLAKAEEKKRKKLEKKLENEKEKAEKLAATAAAAEEVIEAEVCVEADAMDDIINKALDILNGEDFATVSASDDLRHAAEPEEDTNTTADYINRAMDMLNDGSSDLPKQSRKRARDSAGSQMLKNSMSMDTVMDFDRFLEGFDDEHFVSDDSSAGEEDNNEAAGEVSHRRVRGRTDSRGNKSFEEGFLHGIEPVSVSQMHTSFNALENDLNNIGHGREGGWGTYDPSIQMHSQLPRHMMQLPGGNSGVVSDLDNGLGYGAGFESQYQNLLALNARGA